ncbi:hypothetical protein ACFYS8_13470 [Kitasatospora sp. NPDC004615]|uniref:hypothetical protein n=1 Tax=Kitasatospora sp. NPDC004615 TaxID=3364017 RepID=UPI0036D10A59
MAFASRWLKPRGGAGGQTRTDTRLASGPGGGMPTGPLTVRSGVVPGGDPFALTGAGMVPTIGPGRAVVQGGGALQGAYPVAVTIAESMSAFADGNGINPRIDLIVLRVYDPEFDAVGTAQVVLERVPGTPAPAPTAPAVPPGATALWEIPVAATASAANPINWSARVDRRQYTVAAGGVVPGPDTSPGAYDGQLRDRGTATGLERWNGPGAAWESRLYLGTSGRLVIGADVELYRDAANRLRTPDSLIVDGDLSVTGVGGWIPLRKTADQQYTNTTQTNDTALSVALPANSEYLVDGHIIYGAHPSSNMLMGFTGPTGAAFGWSMRSAAGGASSTVTPVIVDLQQIGTFGFVVGGITANTTKMTGHLMGRLTIGATPGTFRFTAAQNVANAAPGIVYAGSWIRLHRVV